MKSKQVTRWKVTCLLYLYILNQSKKDPGEE